MIWMARYFLIFVLVACGKSEEQSAVAGGNVLFGRWINESAEVLDLSQGKLTEGDGVFQATLANCSIWVSLLGTQEKGTGFVSLSTPVQPAESSGERTKQYQTCNLLNGTYSYNVLESTLSICNKVSSECVKYTKQ